MKFVKYLPLMTSFITPVASATVACNGFGVCGTTYGVLSGIAGNFDIANDTDRPAHGFEIDYEGAYSAQVGYTWTYSRYGAPTVSEYKDAAGTNHAVVHYESKKDAAGNWVSNTIPLTGTWTTGGHSCTSPVGNTGCEHFVTGMSAGPFGAKSVSYYWLVDDGTGKLIKGTSVGSLAPGATMAAPVFQAPAPLQPAPLQPAVMQPPVVQVIPVQPVPKEKVEPAPAQWGEPVWLKVTKTTTHNKKIGKDIGDVVKALVNEDNNGDNLPDWQNGQEAQVESEWYLIQKPPVGDNGGAKEAHVGAAEQVGADETITRKYEWFENIAPAGPNGSFDGETHEQMCDGVGLDGIHGTGIKNITDPNGGSYNYDCSQVVVVGTYLAGNMVAFQDVMPLTQLEALPDMIVNKAMAKRTTVFGGNAPYIVTTSGNVPVGISFESDTGIMSGTPTTPGLYDFTVDATDTDGTVVSKVYSFNVLQANGQPVAPPAAQACSGISEVIIDGTARNSNIAKFDGTILKSAYITTSSTMLAIPAAGVAYTFNGDLLNGTFPNGGFVTYTGSYGAAVDANGLPMFCIPATVTVDPAPVVVVPTATPVPATATPVPTAIPTATPVPATATPVPTAVPTATPIPATATPVPTAVPTATPTPVPTIAPTPVPVVSCVAPAGSKSWKDVHNKLKGIDGATLTIGSKQVATLPCTTIQWKGTAKSLKIGYDVDANKGYIFNGVNYATNLIVDNGQ